MRRGWLARMLPVAAIAIGALCFALAGTQAFAQSCAVPGAVGPGTPTGIVNSYYPGSGSAGAGSTSIVLGSRDARGAGVDISPGDLVLVIQVQDASIDSSLNSAYGGSAPGQGYTNINSSGLYEYAVATNSVAGGGGTLTIASPLLNSYRTAAMTGGAGGSGQKTFQVLRVPQYSQATISGTISAPTWNGATGGIVAFDVAGQLNWNAQSINVNSAGFRGGGGQNSTGNSTGVTLNNTDYRSAVGAGTINLAGTGSVPNGSKGEGVAGTPLLVADAAQVVTATGTASQDGISVGYPNGSFGRGAPGNGGGGGTDGDPNPAPAGGNDQNTGGAGGGNYGIGGKGGFGWTPGTPPGVDAGGFGGYSVPAGAARIFFGGGGGAGSANNATGSPGNGAADSGAPGGGMVFIRAGSVTGAGTINAQGASANSTILNDASGGGGAGGSVLLYVDNSGGATGATINVQGGSGGSNTGGGQPHGPGGGGSGGYAITSGAATFNVAGGANGTTATSATSTANYGSSASVGGFQITTLNSSQIPGAGSTRACFPQLTVTKTTSTPTVAQGTAATWAIKVANAAAKQTATTVTIADVLPGNPNITYASNVSVALAGGATRTATVDPAGGATSPAWGTFSIPASGSVTLTFLANVAAVTPAATYQNPATVTYLDPTRTAAGQTVTPGGVYQGGGAVGGSNYASGSSTLEDVTVVTAPTIAKTFNPGAVSIGGTTQLSVVITNPGTVALANVGLVDTYPAGVVNAASPAGASTCGGTVTAAAGGGSFTFSGGAIGAAGSCTLTINVAVTSAGPYTNTIPASALTDTQNITNPAAASATLYNNVTVAKVFSPTAVPANTDSTLTLTFSNGNTIAMNVANPGLTDNLPPGLVATGGAVASTCAGFAPNSISANATSYVMTAGTIPASGSCTLSFAVRSSTVGIYSNTTSGVTTTQANTTGPPSNTANLGVGLVNITKAFAQSSIVSGATSLVTFTLNNPTGVAQTGGNFTDTLVNMQVAAPLAVGGTCTGTTPSSLGAGQTAISFTGINVPAGTCTITFTVTSNVVGNQTNTSSGVTTTGPTGGLPIGPASNTATLPVLARPTIAKAFSPSTIAPNGTSTLTFTITNTGPIPLSGMAFTDTYGGTIVNASPLTVGGSCTGVANGASAGGNTFNVTLGNIPANASCTITVLVTSASASGSFTNTASAVNTTQTGAGVTGSNTATLNVASAPTIAKAFGTSPISQGGTSVITFTLTNGNTIPLNNLNFTDTLTNMSVSNAAIGGTCAGTTNAPALVVGATALNLTVPTLGAGGSCTITVTVTSSVSGTNPNTTSGVTSTQTPVAGAASNTANLVVLSPPTMTKSFVPGSIQTGGTTSIVFTVTNPNSTALTNIAFSDTLVNMQLGAAPTVTETCAGSISGSAGIVAGSTSFSVTLSGLTGGGSPETCTITVSPVTSSTVSPAGGHPNTTSSVTSTQTPAGSAGPTGFLNVLAAPTITKSFNPNNVVGATSPCPSAGCSTITFTLTNPNALALTNVTFTDTFPANMRTVAAAQNFIGAGRGTCTGTIPSAQGAVNQTALTFSSTTIPPNSSCTVMADVQVTANGVYTNTTTGATSNQTPVAGATASDVLTRGVVNITKSFAPASVQVGTNSTLTFTLVNNSGGARSNLHFTDAFPAGMQAVGGAVTLTGACTNLTPAAVGVGAAFYNLTDLDNLANNATCTISLTVRSTASGILSNTVTGTAPAQFTGSTDTATLTSYAAPTIAKAFAPATIAAGGTSTLTFTLTNPNNFAALTGAAFTDTLTSMSISGAQTVGGTCAGTTPAALANGATALSFTGITIPTGGSCTVTVVVTSSTVGTLPNVTSGVTTTETPTVGAASASVNLTVGGINLTKAFSASPLPVGVPTTLTITLTSTQAVNWSGLTFTDTLPGTLVVAPTPNAATTCPSGVVTATAGTNSVSLASGTLAAGAGSCTVTVDVVSPSTGTFTNATANFSAMSTGMSAAGASAAVTYVNNATLTKSFTTATIAPGGTTPLVITLTAGAGAGAAANLGFVDTLPANVLVATPNGLANTCGGAVTATAGSGSITLANGALGAAPASCTITVNATSSVLGTYTNNSTNFSAFTGGLTANAANASFQVVGTTLTKAFAPAQVGRNVASTLTFTIANGTGNPTQSGLAFTDTLPTSVVVATPNGLSNTCGGAVTAPAGSATISLSGGTFSGASCTIAVNVLSATAGTYPNTTSNISGANAAMNVAGVSSTLMVLDFPTASKAFGVANLASGGNTSLTLTFTNPNNFAVTGLAFTDTFPVAPGAMTLFNTTTTNTCGGSLTDSGGGALNAGDVGIKLTGGTINANTSCTVVVNITASVAGSYTNTIPGGTITTTNAGTIAGATSASITVIAPPTISKAFATPIGVGGTSTLTFTVTNPNAGAALTGVAFSDTFPVAPGAMVVANPTGASTSGCGAATYAPVAGAASIAFSAGTIAASGTCTVTVNVTAPAGGTYNNTSGTVSATGPAAVTGGSASASLDVRQVAVTKAYAPTSIPTTTTSTLTFTLTNGAGNPAQSNITFTDTLTAGAGLTVTGVTALAGAGCSATTPTFTATSPASVTLTGATMAAATATCTFTVTVRGNTAGAYANTSPNVTGATAVVDASGVNSTLTVVNRAALSKAYGTTTIGIAQTSTLTFTVTNGAGNPAQSGLAFTDTFPAGLTVTAVGAVAGAGCSGTPGFTASTVTLTAGAITAGNASCTFTATVRGDTAGSYANATAAFSAVGGGLDVSAVSATLNVRQVAVTKAYNPTSIAATTSSTLTFTLTNGAGNPAQSNITFTDALTAGSGLTITGVTALSGAGCSATTPTFNASSPASVTLTGATMAVTTASCTFTVTVQGNTAGAYANTSANVSGATAVVDASGVNSTLTVVNRASLAKAYGTTTIGIAQTSTLTFTVNNGAGNPAQSNLAFTDTFPAGLTVTAVGAISGTGCSGTPGFTASTVTLTGGAITAGNTPCTFTATVRGDTAGTYTNATAAFSGVGGGLDVSTVSAILNVRQVAVTKLYAPTSIATTGSSTLTFTLANGAGNPAQSNITFTDTLTAGAGLTVTGVTALSGAGCSATTPTFTATSPASVTITGATMAAATASCTFTVTVQGNTAGAYANTSTNVTGATAVVDASGVNSTLTVFNRASLSKAYGTTTIGIAQTSTLTFTIANGAGNPAQSNLAFTDTFPAGLTVTAVGAVTGTGCSGTPGFSASTVTLTGGAITAGNATCTFTATIRGDTAGTYTNATAAFSGVGGQLDVSAVSAALNVRQVAVTKAYNPTSIAATTASTLTFTLANGAGNPAQSNITFTDTLTAGSGLTVTGVTALTGAGCSATTPTFTATSPASVTLTGATMAVTTASCTFTVTVQGNTAGAYANTSANVTGATAVVDASGVSSTLTVVNRATLSKAYATTTIGIAQTSTLTFTIANGAGNPAQSNLAFTDTFPAGLTVTAVGAISGTGCSGTPGFTASTVTLSAGAVTSGNGPCTFTATIRGDAAGTYTNAAAAFSAVGGGLDVSAVSATLNVRQVAVTKAYNPTSIPATSSSTLTFTLANGAGNPAQSNITFTDTLTAGSGLTVTGVTALSGAGCSATTPTFTATSPASVTLTGATMAVTTASCTFTVTVQGNTTGAYANTSANVSGATAVVDASGVNSTLTVVNRASLAKAYGTTTIGIAQTSTLTFTVNNGAGNPAQSNLAFTDTFPAGLTVTAVGAVTGTGCSGTPGFTASTVTLSAGAITSGNGPCTFTATVRGDTAGAYTNATAAFSGVGGGLDVSTVSATLNVRQVAVTKLYAPTSIATTGSSTLTFTLTNGAGNPAQSNITFTDTLTAGAGLTITGVTALSGAGCSATTPTFTASSPASVTLTGATMAVTTASCTFTVTVQGNTAGAYANTSANVSAATAVVDASGVSSTLTVVNRATLSKAYGTTTIGVAQASTLTFTIANGAGNPAQSGLAFTDTFPAGLTVTAVGAVSGTGCSGTPGFTASTVTLSAGAITSGNGPCTFTATIRGDAAGTYTNATAAFSGVGGGLDVSTVSATLNVRQVAVTKLYAPTSIATTGSSTLTFTLTNGAGNPAQSNITFTDTLTAGAGLTISGVTALTGAGCSATTPTFTATSPASVTLTGATMAVTTASCTFTVTVLGNTAGAYANTSANVTGATAVVDASGVSSTLTVVNRATLSKAYATTTIGIAQTSTLTFTIANGAGNPAQSNLAFTDTFPAGLTVTAVGAVAGTGCSGTPGFTASTVTLSAGAITSGNGPCTFTATIRGDTAGTYTNATAAFSGVGGGLDVSAVSATLNVRQVAVTKAYSPTSIPATGSSTLTFTLTNGAGNPAQSNITFTDTLTAGSGLTVTGVTALSGAGCSATTPTFTATSPASVTLTGATMAVTTASCTFTVTVQGNTAGAYANTSANVSGATAVVDASGVNSTLTVVNRATLSKAYGTTTIGIAQTSTLTFTIANGAGNPAQSGLAFTDTFPAGLTVTAVGAISGTGCSGTPGFTASTVTLSAGAITSGNGPCTFTATIRGDAAGTYTNATAAFSGVGGGLDVSTVSATLNVRQVALTKGYVPTSIATTASSTLTFTLTNGAGNPAQSNVTFTDTLTAGSGLTISGVTALSGVGCSATTPTFTASNPASVTLTGATMAVTTASCTFTVTVQGNTAGAYANTSANVTGATAVVDASGVSSTLTVINRASLTKAYGTTTIGIAQSSTLTFTIANGAGNPAQSNLAFTDTFPAGLTVTAVGAMSGTGCSGATGFTASTVTLSAGAITSGNGPCTFTATIRGDAAGTYTNATAAFSGVGGGLDVSTVSATLNVRQVAVTKLYAPTSIATTGSSTLTFTLTNGAGNPAQSNITFTDTLTAGAGLTISGVTALTGAGCSATTPTFTATSPASVTLTGATMAVTTASCTFTVTVLGNTAGAYANTSANVTGATAVVDASGVSSTLTVVNRATLSKAYATTTIGIAQTSTLTFTIANGAGNPAQSNLAFTDTFPAGLTVTAVGAVAGTGCSGTPGFTASTVTLSAGAITSGNGPCTFTATIRGDTAGAYTNATAAFSGVGGGLDVSTVSATLNVRQVALTKGYVPTSIATTASSTLTFTIANGAGNPAQSNITFTDTLTAGAGLTITGVTALSGAGCSATTPTFTASNPASVTLTGATMAVTTASCTFTVTVQGNAAASYANTSANVSGATAVVDASGVNSTLTVINRASLTKAYGTTTIGIAQSSTLTFTIANGAGNPAQSNLAFTDAFPAGLTVTAVGAMSGTGCSGATGFTASTVTLSAGAITSGNGPCTFTATIRGDTAGTYTNATAAFSGLGGSLDVSTVSATLNVRQVALTKAYNPASIAATASSTLTFTLTNGAGNPAQSNVTFTDTLTAGAGLTVTGVTALAGAGCSATTPTFTASSPASVTLTGATMAVTTASCTFTVTVQGNTAGAYANTSANVSAATAVVDASGVSSTLTVVNRATLSKAYGTTTIGVAQTSTLTFTIANGAGNPAQSGLAFTDTFPAGLSVTAVGAVSGTGCSGTPGFTASTVTLSGGAITAGNSTCTFTATIRGDTAGSYTNASGAFSGVGGSLDVSGVTASLDVRQVAVTKAYNPASIAVTTTSTLTFTLANGTGNPAQSNITFTDTLTAGAGLTITGVTALSGAGCSATTPTFNASSPASVTLTGATMAAATASCTFTVTVQGNTAGAYANTSANVSGATAVVDVSGVNSTLTVFNRAALTKAYNPTAVGIGQPTTLTFTITNGAGNPAQSNLAFTDTFPAGLTVTAVGAVTGTGCSGTPGFTASTVTLSGGAITAGNSTCTFTATIRGDTAGSYANAPAAFSGVGGTLDVSGVSATLDVRLASLNKAFSPTSIAANGTSTLNFTITNGAGNPSQSGINFTDALPGIVRIAGAPNVQTNCPAGAAFGAPGFAVTATAGTAVVTGTGVTLNAGVASCAVRVDVTGAIGGAYTNDSTNISGLANVSNAVTPSTLTIGTVAPTIAKVFAPATVNANQVSTLTITLTNANDTAANLTAALTDTLPGPVVVAGTPNASTTCSGSGAVTAGANSVTLPATRSIPAASGTTPGSCTVQVDVVSAIGGTFTNTIAANALQTSNGNNASAATADLAVNAAAPSIAKAFAPAAVAADGTSTITFTISNPNAVALTPASFTDTLANMAVSGAQSAGGTCAGAGSNSFANAQAGLLTFSGLTIPAAAGATPGSCTVTIVVTSDIPGAQPNQASGVASPQAPTGAASNTATLTVTAATPTIAKAFSPASIAIGAASTITFTLANTNGIALTGGSFTDTLTGMSISGVQSAGGTCAGAAANSFANAQTALAFSGLTIPANNSCTVTVVVTSSVVGSYPNQASGVASNEAATGAASNSATLTVTATAPVITKSFTPATISSGGVSTLTVTITNPNATAITVTSLTDTFPVAPGSGLVRAATPNASTTCAGGAVSSTAGSVTLTGGTVPASNGSCTFQIDVTAATGGTYTNTIAIGALTSSAGSNAAAATAQLTVNPVANIAVTKLGPASIATGAPITYSISVTNAGPDAANGTTFSDAVPALVTGVNAVCAGAAGGAACGAMNVTGNSVTSTIPTLPVGGSVSITITGTTSGVGSMTNTATVAPPAGVTDPVAANNTSSVTTTILAPDLTIAKTHAGNFTVGTNGTYTITVSNSAGSLATGGTITVTDSLPAGLGFVSATGTGWACSFSAPTVTCTTGASVNAGASANAITLVVSVASTAVPSVINFATVSGGGEPAGVTGNNTASDNTIVVAASVNTFQPDNAQSGMPGTVLFYAHTFTAGAAGNVTFATSAVTTPAIAGWTQIVYRDTNCNGVLDGAEGTTPLTAPVAMVAGDQVCIVVKDSIPATAPYNAQNNITVTATFNAQPYTRTDHTTVGSAAGSGLVLAKSVRNVTQGGAAGTSGTARPNDILEYTITFTNTSSGSLSAIVVTDATPAFTTYQAASCGAPLPANLSGCSVTTQPAVNGAGSIVWTLTGTLQSNGSGSVVYTVRVAP